MISNTPPTKQNNQGSYFDIIDGLCRRFMGLSPIEVLNSDLKDVYDLYVDLVINDHREKYGSKADQGGAVWVTSKTATWH